MSPIFPNPNKKKDVCSFLNITKIKENGVKTYETPFINYFSCLFIFFLDTTAAIMSSELESCMKYYSFCFFIGTAATITSCELENCIK
jgi:hypothetical protein